jgi:hypothetical protein
MWIEPFETFQKEWPQVKAAPWSFITFLSLIAGAVWTVIHWLYRHRLEQLNGTISYQEKQIEHLQKQLEEVDKSKTNLPVPLVGKRVEERREVELTGVKRAQVKFNEYSGYWEISNNSSHLALITSFHFNPQSPNRTRIHIRAHIRLTDKDSKAHSVIIPVAYWLDEKLSHIYMNCGDHRSILLIVKQRNALFTVQNEGSSSSSSGMLYHGLSDSDKAVEVTLMEDEYGFCQTFELDIVDLKKKLELA